MAGYPLTLALALSAVLLTPSLALAETRGERNFRSAGGSRIPDLPAGHWATNATQDSVANEVVVLDGGAFNGERAVTGPELQLAMNRLAATAEAIADKGTNGVLRRAIDGLDANATAVTRYRLAATLAGFLDACASQELIAIAAANKDASRFKDVGATVPAAVSAVVDKYKVMTGFPDDTFRPDGTVNRYQLAAIAHNILDRMRMAPLAQLPVGPIVIVRTAEPVEIVVVDAVPTGRRNFRERAPIHVSWQAINASNVAAGAPFATIPLEGMLTIYNGPLMLQNVTNVKVTPQVSNMVDSQFRVGYAGFKQGWFQAIPYLGAHIGAGASQAPGDIQYDSYAGVTYGGILSLTPSDVLEFHAQLGQTQLLQAGRFTGAFQPLAYPNALGSVLTQYGVGADFYIAPNICLTLGTSTWQNPTSLRVGNVTNAQGIVDTFGLNVGIGSRF